VIPTTSPAVDEIGYTTDFAHRSSRALYTRDFAVGLL